MLLWSAFQISILISSLLPDCKTNIKAGLPDGQVILELACGQTFRGIIFKYAYYFDVYGKQRKNLQQWMGLYPAWLTRSEATTKRPGDWLRWKRQVPPCSEKEKPELD